MARDEAHRERRIAGLERLEELDVLVGRLREGLRAEESRQAIESREIPQLRHHRAEPPVAGAREKAHVEDAVGLEEAGEVALARIPGNRLRVRAMLLQFFRRE